MPALVEPLLAVHSATTAGWLADAAATAAERGLGALYGLLYLADASGGQLIGERPASNERMRRLLRVNQDLGVNLTTLRFDPLALPEVRSALEEGRAKVVPELAAVLPLGIEPDRVGAVQRRLGVAEVWLAPLYWNSESSGLLVLLMPAGAEAPLALAELLGRHLAVALKNLREKEAGRKRGELDAVRWVYDEQRLTEQLLSEVRRAQRHKRPLSVLLLRVENFYDLRARYGRFLAERVLRQVGGATDDTLRHTDFLGAFGDDAFAAILVETDEPAAARARERLLANLHAVTLPQTDLPDFSIQYACATATLSVHGDTAEEILAAAETQLGEETKEDVA